MREIIEQILEENGFKLYDIEISEENGHNYYRIYMQKEGSDKSVTLDDCALINRIVSPIFDVEYNSDDSYFLEVSSPGVERSLTKPEHFEKSVGEKVKLKLNDGTKIKGVLQEYDSEKERINVKNKVIPLDSIKKARTYFEWK
jgi:ribosome maturation factor RimP